jgi:glycosyltransferase involved in cell wall biosynthesis
VAEPVSPPGGEQRVLLVLADSAGGIGRHVKTLAAGLPSRGFSVAVCAPPATLATLGLAPDVTVVAAPIGRAGPIAGRAAHRALRRAAATSDLVHAHGLRAGAAAAAAARAPLVVTWHNAPQGGSVQRAVHAALARYVARAADLTLAASDDLAAAARTAGQGLVRSTFVAAPTLPPPARSRAQMRDELEVGERPLVLAVGRLQRQKRFDVLVEAAAAWADDPAAPLVLIAGDGPDEAKLAAQIAATRAPVRLLGARGDIAELLVAADVFALPSEWEARSLVAQEAMRAGVPLVATAVGGLPSLVGEAAVLVEVGDSTALRHAIEAVLADASYRDRLVALGRARALTWPDEPGSVDEVVRNYLDLMDRLRLR